MTYEETEEDRAEKRAMRPRPTVKQLFAMSNEALLDEWHMAKLDELETRVIARRAKASTSAELAAIDKAQANEETKLAAELVRLVISFRLMGREVIKPPEGDE
jgi:hypothetical protein